MRRSVFLRKEEAENLRHRDLSAQNNPHFPRAVAIRQVLSLPARVLREQRVITALQGAPMMVHMRCTAYERSLQNAGARASSIGRSFSPFVSWGAQTRRNVETCNLRRSCHIFTRASSLKAHRARAPRPPISVCHIFARASGSEREIRPSTKTKTRASVQRYALEVVLRSQIMQFLRSNPASAQR